MTKNTYNPYEIMMDKYDKEEMLSDVKLVILEARIFGADAHFSRSAALCGKGSHPAWSSIHGASPPSVQNTLR